ncbi:MAG: NADH-quinone oxidoreductase subunit N [Desulfobulbaceae bacterium]|uniref:NADH-quinone oxidoreductase subunit N n=1 Tax=Candidatus Desulfatifera sulfidica TaxID=2841691 RepID=A0A8J6T9B6_9BACT|nr:NADH-quinone oxidoreductase subunit N [Candidatus Desulfatifera sulfidica]
MQFLPELTLLGASLILFMVSLKDSSNNGISNIAIILGALVFGSTLLSFSQEGSLFFNSYKVDLFSQIFKTLIAGAMLVVLLLGRDLKGINTKVRPEYYLFMFISTLGLMMLVSSVELLAIFVALELSSFAVYIMVPMRDDSGRYRIQMEAGIKYLLFGVTATGFMLFGMSYMYGLTGSTQLPVIIESLSSLYSEPAAVIAVLMVLAGFFYKLAIFPFHFWVPDVYEGASNETTAFIASVPKLAATAMLIRVVTMINGDGQVIVNVLMVCAVLSMFYGNLSALVQKDIKRMLGFSGIAHAGFVLLGILTMQITGYANAIYYIIGYVVMNLACFLVICTVSKEGENVQINDLSGLHQRAPLLALTLGIGLFALAGIPPFVGFMGKFMLLAGALQEGYLLLVILAAINTAIAIFYYLSVIRIAYCSDTEGRGSVIASPLTNIVSVTLLLIITIMGVLPQRFIDFAASAVTAML